MLCWRMELLSLSYLIICVIPLVNWGYPSKLVTKQIKRAILQSHPTRSPWMNSNPQALISRFHSQKSKTNFVFPLPYSSPDPNTITVAVFQYLPLSRDEFFRTRATLETFSTTHARMLDIKPAPSPTISSVMPMASSLYNPKKSVILPVISILTCSISHAFCVWEISEPPKSQSITIGIFQYNLPILQLSHILSVKYCLLYMFLCQQTHLHAISGREPSFKAWVQTEIRFTLAVMSNSLWHRQTPTFPYITPDYRTTFISLLLFYYCLLVSGTPHHILSSSFQDYLPFSRISLRSRVPLFLTGLLPDHFSTQKFYQFNYLRAMRAIIVWCRPRTVEKNTLIANNKQKI